MHPMSERLPVSEQCHNLVLHPGLYLLVSHFHVRSFLLHPGNLLFHFIYISFIDYLFLTALLTLMYLVWH